MAPRRATGVRVKNLGEFRRGLRKLDRDLDKHMASSLRGLAARARDRARVLLRARSANPQNRIERTIGTYSRQRSAGIQTSHPGGGVQEYGGEIAPRGAPIQITAKRHMNEAVEAEHDNAERAVGDLLEDLWSRGGAA